MYIDLNSLDFDDKIFASKIEDMFILCDKNSSVKFSNFLDERQQALAAQIAGKYKHINYCFFTGINDCERAVMCVLPAFADKNQVSAPIKIISVKFRQQDKLTHRDFLGALMALKIKRDSLGDIIVDEGKAYIVCNSIAGEIIVNELKTVGRIGVECFYEDNPIINKKDNLIELNTVVSSLRLDCVASAITGLSREKTLNMIKSGLVSHNFQISSVPHKEIKADDKLSIRGYGKFLICEIGGLTKKNKVRLIYKKYV